MLSHRLGQSNQLPGGGLPFYKEGTEPQRYAYARQTAWICPSEQSIPFQVAGPTSAGLPVLEVYRFDTGDLVQADISSVVLTKKCLSDGREIITNLGSAMGLGFSTFYLKLIFGTTSYISDTFHVCSSSAMKAYSVEWSDTRPWVGGCYYGDGYKNRIWIEGAAQRPKTEYTQQFEQDGYGVQQQVYARVDEIHNIEFFCTDSMFLLMSRLVLHNDVKIKPPGIDDYLPVKSAIVNDKDSDGWIGTASLNFKNHFAESQYNGWEPYEVTVC